MTKYESQNSIDWTTLLGRSEQLRPARLQQLAVLDASRTDRLAGSATETAIDVTFKGRACACESLFADGAHQVETAAWTIVLVASNNVCWACFEAEPAMNAGQEFLFFRAQGSC